MFAPGRRGQVAYRKRFIRHYTSGGLKLSKKNSKPDDYEKIFEGSIDDNFKIGISVLNSGLKVCLYTFLKIICLTGVEINNCLICPEN